jgi:hypothetical protein
MPGVHKESPGTYLNVTRWHQPTDHRSKDNWPAGMSAQEHLLTQGIRRAAICFQRQNRTWPIASCRPILQEISSQKIMCVCEMQAALQIAQPTVCGSIIVKGHQLLRFSVVSIYSFLSLFLPFLTYSLGNPPPEATPKSWTGLFDFAAWFWEDSFGVALENKYNRDTHYVRHYTRLQNRINPPDLPISLCLSGGHFSTFSSSLNL